VADLNEDQTLVLSDGRTLGYAEYGDSAGAPLFFFHGFPGTRHMGKTASEVALKLKLRLICPDRPGFGLSDFQKDRTIADWPGDVVQLADALGLDRFGVIGVSGGGPYAAACARFIPERLNRTSIVCGVGPFNAPNATQGMGMQNRIMFGVSRYLPGMVGALMARMMNSARRDPDKAIQRMKASLPAVDQRVLERPEARDIFLDSAAPRADSRRAIAQEAALYVNDWGFELSDIRAEVHLYQGELDLNVSPNMGRIQAAQIPNCDAHFYPDEGHMSLVLNRTEEYLRPFAP
jgi:pimeloyl-ACP methyl ester carboxylesterase